MNGPEGVFNEGTRAFVNGIAALGKTGVVSYVIMGGGATLELLADDLLPGVEAIANFAE